MADNTKLRDDSRFYVRCWTNRHGESYSGAFLADVCIWWGYLSTNPLHSEIVAQFLNQWADSEPPAASLFPLERTDRLRWLLENRVDRFKIIADSTNGELQTALDAATAVLGWGAVSDSVRNMGKRKAKKAPPLESLVVELVDVCCAVRRLLENPESWGDDRQKASVLALCMAALDKAT